MPSRSKKHRSTMITVEQMVDIALGTPEIGAVNFNVLHAVLHVIIQQLNIQKCLVEFKGHDAERMEGIIMTAKPGPILKVTEYMLDLTDGKPCPDKNPYATSTQPSPRAQTDHTAPRSKYGLQNSVICPPKEELISDVDDADGKCTCGPEFKKRSDSVDRKEIKDSVSEKSDAKKKEKDAKEEIDKTVQSKDETEKTDTTQEKNEKFMADNNDNNEYGNDKVEKTEKAVKVPASTDKPDKPQKAEKDKDEKEKDGAPKKKKTPKDTKELESEDEETRKRLKRERCKEQKLMKRKIREEFEITKVLAGAREKSEAEKPEKEIPDECIEETKGGLRKVKPCPCKQAHKQNEPCPELKLRGPPSTYYGSDDEGGCQTIVRVESIAERCDSWRSRPALAHESLVKLEERVTLLQDAFDALEKMPTNEELMKRTSVSGCVPTPVKDLWQIYNLNKRVESCEGAIEKLASMIEDIVKETCNFREAMMVIADAVDSMECNEETCANRGSQCYGKSAVQNIREAQANSPCPTSREPEEQPQVVAYPISVPNPCKAFAAASSGRPSGVQSEVRVAEVQVNAEIMSDAVEEQVMGGPQGAEPIQDNQNYLGQGFYKLNTGEKFCVIKDAIECLSSQFQRFTDIIPMEQLAAKLCSIVTMQKQLDNLQKEWEQYLNSFSSNGVRGAVEFIKSLKLDIESLNEMFNKAMEDRRNLDSLLQDIQQDISTMKAMKADKETMEDLLAEKADASVVNRKVSHDQFDAACDDLTKGLDDALERLIAQESMWNEAMDEIQKDLENKLDKLEIMPLKEFINKKLKGLQEKLKQLAQLRKDAEAAGAKSRILRNLNCIACDNDVIMRMDNKNQTQHSTMPQSKSMRPYIAYDLDQVRKALKKGPCRPSSHAEETNSEVQKKTIGLPMAAVREGVEAKINKLEHYCNRYCGGSHTITTPQQRVTRIGHFLTEFGPHAMAMFNQSPNQDCKTNEPQKEQKP